ncbi:MAG: NAD-dependent epimerase/dehydratase family protein [Opitutae bacterium]|nr:NAD-dependent epimerase/dehydratase family protein [Opitutae bacterium]
MSAEPPVFITGASGFIGGKLAERLLAAGRPVRALARRPLPALEKLGAEIVLGDLHDDDTLRRGCAGAGTVFHVAGRVGVWGPDEDFFRVNVEGTRHVIAACRAAGVPRLVYTSSPSVVYHGGDLAGVDESAPLCTVAPCAYPTSKAAAERLVSAANSAELGTVSLRPHLVWGPGDKNVVPRVLALAKKGRLKIVGAGKNLVDCTHITNVVDAHLLAEQALGRCHIIDDTSLGGTPETCHLLSDKSSGSANVGGRAYFITNGEPVVLWDWINELLRGTGRPEIQKHVSLGTAYRIGGALEFLWRALPLKGEPPMTRFVAKELATDHWFKIDAARRDLGYAPCVTMAAGTAELIAHYRAGNAY